MTYRSVIDRLFQQEQINFLVTNRIPRRLLTRFMGWFSGIEQPLVRDLSIGLFQFFAGDLHLDEARKARFDSLHDCFIRELKEGARPVDPTPGTLVSPCDGLVGACGRLRGTELIQAKGAAYTLEELVADARLVDRHAGGTFVTLRLTASMYHRFHAPHDCEVAEVQHFAGDTWNVNPAALRRVPRLFCRNERVVVPAALHGSAESITLVPVGAILVASIHLHCLGAALNRQYAGPSRIPCRASFRKGQEMGYFRHGSTIIVLSTPGLALAPQVREGSRIRVGEPLLVHAPRSAAQA
jgi:phosphatidylserine decarboxylase